MYQLITGQSSGLKLPGKGPGRMQPVRLLLFRLFAVVVFLIFCVYAFSPLSFRASGLPQYENTLSGKAIRSANMTLLGFHLLLS